MDMPVKAILIAGVDEAGRRGDKQHEERRIKLVHFGQTIIETPKIISTWFVSSASIP